MSYYRKRDPSLDRPKDGYKAPWEVWTSQDDPPQSFYGTDRRPKDPRDGQKWHYAKRSTFISMNAYWNYKYAISDRGWSASEYYLRPGWTESELQVNTRALPFTDQLAGKVRSLCSSIPDKNKSLVTKVTAEAKAAEYDLLSELGELPETIKMFHDLVKGLKRPLELVKKHKEYLRKAKEWDQSWKKQLNRLRKQYEKARSVERKKVLKNRYDTLFKKQNPFGWFWRRKKRESLTGYASKGVTKAAETWLLYRYGVMPLLYSARDIVSAMNKKAQVYKTTRAHVTEQKQEEFGSWNTGPFGMKQPLNYKFVIEYVQVDRVTYKQCFDGNVIGRLIGINPLVTAWELTTLSFVVDWFIQVGDFIQAISPSYAQQTEVVYSRKLKGTVRTVQNPTQPPTIDPGSTFKSKIKLDGTSGTFESYYREVIDPMSHLTIPREIVLNWKRELDAFALTWTRLRPFLENLKKEENRGKIQFDATKTQWRRGRKPH